MLINRISTFDLRVIQSISSTFKAYFLEFIVLSVPLYINSLNTARAILKHRRPIAHAIHVGGKTHTPLYVIACSGEN